MNNFFSSHAEAIGKLDFSAEQVEFIVRYVDSNPNVRSDPTEIVLLKGALKRAGGDADKFFAIFNAVACFSHPGDACRDLLNRFFTGNAKAIGELAFSAQQAERIAQYVNRDATEIVLLEGALKRTKGDADKFFAIFDAIACFSPPSDNCRDTLNKFFTRNAKAIGELAFSAEQIERMANYIKRDSMKIVLLKGALKHAGGDADKFFAIFDFLFQVLLLLKTKYRDALNRFFLENAEAIMDLELSTLQIESINNAIDRHSTSIKILKLTLEKGGKRP